jgi:hypothetical protein
MRLHTTISLVVNIGMGTSLFLQGTWLVQIGLSMSWMDVGNDTPMFIHVIFMWHVLGAVVFALMLLTAAKCGMTCYFKRRNMSGSSSLPKVFPHRSESGEFVKLMENNDIIEEELDVKL